ncbi:MAG: OmpA family protein, partial [Myxococcales bacterium]|nr:OmpA family protein [Myxococcales bacterium]
DACPDEPEDFDEFEDTDGCPDLDDDRDGIPDVSDACRLEPEDVDGFSDEDGCPDPDNDADGILDRDDACPNEPEVVNGVDDQDGCPDEGLIQLLDDRIVLEERVLFDFERARVKHAARPVLDAIVELVRQHPEWALMRVDGHADVRGDADFNRRLSERRARNVMRALVERGLAAERLEFRGFGSERPRDHRRTEEAHQRNRRVEFVIVARRGADGALQRTEVRDETDASLD